MPKITIAAVLAGVALAFMIAAAPTRAQMDAPKEGKKTNFVTPGALDLTTLLPPPPANDSAQTKAELAELRQMQSARTPEREKIAQEDQTETVFAVIRTDLGSAFAEDKLPVAAAFFRRILSDEGVIVDPAKDAWARPRPPLIDPELKACVKLSKSGAYPSGHTTVAYLSAIVMGDILPEKRGEVFASAARYAESRMVCAVHYPSDLSASRTAAALIVQQMRANPAFKKEFAAARAEIRKVLGLPV